MNLAFCLFNFFPYGGLQRDFLHIARECKERGHEVHVYTMNWDGEPEPGFILHLLKNQHWQNHTRSREFVEQLQSVLSHAGHDVVIGFNKMPGLDVYYAADVCYQGRIAANRGRWYRWLPRYKQWLALEESVFALGKKTQIMLIAPTEQQQFERYYQTEKNRFHLLPPVLAKDRTIPANAEEIRHNLRSRYQVADQDFILLMVASRFKIKGLDRALQAFAALPLPLRKRCKLFVIGDDKPKLYVKLARRLQIIDQVMFFGGRQDVPDFLLSADLLVHPAYLENTGTVLLEAIALGLPVLTVDICGYAAYVLQANMGEVVSSPFSQHQFNLALEKMLSSMDRNAWQQHARLFMQRSDVYNMPKKAADVIESTGFKRHVISA